MKTFISFLLCSFFFSCGDYGKTQTDEPHFELHFLGTNLSETGKISSKRKIVLSFLEHLEPLSVTRQNVLLVNADNTLLTIPEIAYEPVTRSISILPPAENGNAWILPNQYYKLLLRGSENETLPGLRSVDGHALRKTLVLPLIGTDESASEPSEKPISYCREIKPIFHSKCISCHGKEHPAAMGLELDTEDGLIRTALEKPSKLTLRAYSSESVFGGTSSSFGGQMALIKPKNPGLSFLLYKVLSHGVPHHTSDPTCSLKPEQKQLHAIATEEVVHRLQSVVLGSPMPLTQASLSFEEELLLSRWMKEGALLETCQGALPSSCP